MTTQTLTLADFLLARIAEDEAAARAATPGPWWAQEASAVYSQSEPWDPDLPWHKNALARCERFDLNVNRNNGHHIARHDPARVLAECESKRRIVELHDDEYVYEMTGRGCDCADEPCWLLKTLALPYDSHPDYRDEWRP